MKKVLILAVAAAIVMFVPSFASAQTATGTLTVTATVQGSIGLVFVSDGAGVPLTGSGTNAATLAFGNVSAYGAVAAGVVRTVNANSFTVSSAVDVNVTKTNSASANYTLKAQLGAADAVNSWTVNSVAVTNAAQATIVTNGAYAANNNYAVAITIPFATASGTAISNTINYTATAN
jgi:hypothetical protein